ncbi:hypothetical protein BH10BAC5_BH10BAC5_01540 [soil metagenome]
MLNKKILILALLLTSTFTFAQDNILKGRVYDRSTNKPLEFVTVKIEGTSSGTVSDIKGNYILKLGSGSNLITFSIIGYNSDSLDINISEQETERNIYLKPGDIMTEEIKVEGEDPAYDIIRKTIRYKKDFFSKLKQYEYDAYSKLLIRSNQSVIPKKEQLNDSSENGKLPIFGILESETKGYFRMPDQEKQIVTSKRETANIIRGFALPFLVNFYDEKVDLGEVKIPGPVSDNAFDNYEYHLAGITSIDSIRIFKIEVTNSSNLLPQFFGTVYILDSIFALVKIDLNTNEAAKLRGIDNIRFLQKFRQYSDDKKETFWLPTDNQIYASGSFLGFVKFNAEVNSIVYDYKINNTFPRGIYDDDVAVKVMLNSEKDSSYWKKNELISTSYEERKAYTEIKKETDRRDKEISLSPFGLKFGKYISSSPLQYYYFNRVEGSHLQFNLNYNSELNRQGVSGLIGYGFDDKKTKYEVNFYKRFFGDRRLVLRGSVFQKLVDQNADITFLSRFYNTARSFYDKADSYDYFYSNGYNLSLNYRIADNLTLGLNFANEKQNSAFNNTDFSILHKEKSYRLNPPINDGFQRIAGTELRIDPNKYKKIDWGNGDISRFRETERPVLNLGFKYSGKDLGSGFEYRNYSAFISGRNNINGFFKLKYRFGGTILNGEVPYQSLGFLPVTPAIETDGLNFKAVDYQEFLGDKAYFFNIENNFGKSIFGNFPVLKSFDLLFFFNAGRTEISDANFNFSANKNIFQTQGIYSELGFGFGGILDIFRVDVAMRLNNFDTGSRYNVKLGLYNF